MQSRNDVSLPLHSVLSMWAGTLPKLVTKAPEGEKKLLCNMHMYSIKSRTAYALILSKLSIYRLLLPLYHPGCHQHRVIDPQTLSLQISSLVVLSAKRIPTSLQKNVSVYKRVSILYVTSQQGSQLYELYCNSYAQPVITSV